MVTVVEESAVPKVVVTFSATVKVLVVRSIKLIEAIKYVLRRVAVNHIQEDDNSHLMSGVNKLLQSLGGSISAAGCEKAVDLVSKASIIGMFHDSHQLNGVVAKVFDSGKYIFRELFIRGDALLWR